MARHHGSDRTRREITLRWTVYDSGDGVLDSTTLIDNWQWLTKPGVVVSTLRAEPER